MQNDRRLLQRRNGAVHQFVRLWLRAEQELPKGIRLHGWLSLE